MCFSVSYESPDLHFSTSWSDNEKSAEPPLLGCIYVIPAKPLFYPQNRLAAGEIGGKKTPKNGKNPVGSNAGCLADCRQKCVVVGVWDPVLAVLGSGAQFRRVEAVFSCPKTLFWSVIPRKRRVKKK